MNPELIVKAKLLIYWLLYVTTLKYHHELWGERNKTPGTRGGNELPLKELPLRDRTRSSVMQERLSRTATPPKGSN